MTHQRAQPIFIVGSSRSGTGMMMRMLRGHPEIHITGETHYFDDLRTKLGDMSRARLDDHSRRRCEDYFLALDDRGYGRGGEPNRSSIAREELRAAAESVGFGSDAYFEAFCRLQARRAGKAVWGEKTPRHVFRIPEMLHSFPTARVICMVRDPRAVVASYRDWTRDLSKNLDATSMDTGHVREQIRRNRSYDPVLVSLMWRSVVGSAERAQRRFGNDRLRIERYEDVLSDPEASVCRLAEWLGLPFVAEMLDVPQANSSYHQAADRRRGVATSPAHRWRDKLSEREVLVVQSVCGRLMERHRYQRKRVELPSRLVVRSWLVLPIAVSRALVANSGRTGNLAVYVWRRLRTAVS